MRENDNYIQENLQSNDPFIRTLFQELDNRVKEFEEEGTTVEKLTFSDTIFPIMIMASIIIFLLTSI